VGSVALEWGAGWRPLDNEQMLEGLPPSGIMMFEPEQDTT
jgi:hypothetical protein